ncbi:hypothetical protein ACOME3_006326 [Neoechinorhynchus agilis]
MPQRSHRLAIFFIFIENSRASLSIFLKALAGLQGSSTREKLDTKKEDVQRLAVNEMRMPRWSAGLTRKDRVPNEEARKLFASEPIEEAIAKRRMRWYPQVTQADEDAARGENEKKEAQKEVEGRCERRFQDAGKGEQRRKPTMLKRTTSQVREKFKEMLLFNK